MTFLEKLLNHYRIDADEYEYLTRNLSDADVPHYSNFDNIEKAKSRILQAIKNNEKIFIYGDYDCDGIMATSIMVKTFKKMGYSNFGYYVPSRYIDGYALNMKRVLEAKEKGYSLIITVDNGVSQIEEVQKAKELGIDVIITDHHEFGLSLPEAYCILHPKLSKISNIITSGGAVAFFLSYALLGKIDHYLLSLAGVSIISDMMEIKQYNRDLVRLALYYINEEKYMSLFSLAENDQIDETTISSTIAPKINSIGRIVEDTTINRLVKYFVSDNRDEIINIGSYILAIHAKRKEITKNLVSSFSMLDENKPGIVLVIEAQEGLAGLLANQLLNKYQKPTIIFTSDSLDKTMYRGSIRSKEGFNITKAIDSLQKYIINGGGHALAGGIEIKKDDLEPFKNDFYALCEKYQFASIEKEYIDINIDEINEQNYQILRTLAPFGMSFDEPLFIVKNFPTSHLTFMSANKHISTTIVGGVRLVGFNISKSSLEKYNNVSLIGKMSKSSFKGVASLQYNIVLTK